MSACNWNNFTDITDEWLHYVVYKIMLPPYFFLGLAANLILLIAFFKQSKEGAAYFYQVILTVSKAAEIFTLTILLIGFDSVPDAENQALDWVRRSYTIMFITIRLVGSLPIHFMIASLLCAVAMAADRVFALAAPFKYKNINHRRHQLIAAVICFALPAFASINNFLTFIIIPEGDHYKAVADSKHISTLTGQICIQVGGWIRVCGLIALVALNITMIVMFRKRNKVTAKLTCKQKKEEANKMNDKTLLLLNISQSGLMFLNHIPRCVGLIMAVTIMSAQFHCYAKTVKSVTDMFIFVTDTIDIAIILAINKKMRGVVLKGVKCG